jgi:tRNA-Thr(GGU) m(6)t(6)A37 methyltransferase TsaA
MAFPPSQAASRIGTGARRGVILVIDLNRTRRTKMSANPNLTTTYQLHPIGTVRQSDQGAILEIAGPFRPALKEMGQFSHILVFWWAHQMDNPECRSLLQTELPYAKGVTAGVFACRAEYRPNPIAVTTCFVLDVDEQHGTVLLPWIDAYDGTPILDLKPYIPLADRIRDVKVASWLAGWPQWMEDAAEYFAAHPTCFGE